MNDTDEPNDGPEITPIELPYFVATLLPDGNLDVRMEGNIPVDKMFTISALAARIANRALDDAEQKSARSVLEVARDLSGLRDVGGRLS